MLRIDFYIKFALLAVRSRILRKQYSNGNSSTDNNNHNNNQQFWKKSSLTWAAMFWVFGISTCQTRRIVVFIVVAVAVVVASADDHIKLEISEA